MTITKKVERLFNNPDFIDIVLEEYIKNGIDYYVLNNDVSSGSIQDELKARKILNDFLQYCLDFDNIETIKKQ